MQVSSIVAHVVLWCVWWYWGVCGIAVCVVPIVQISGG